MIFDSNATESPETGEMVHVPLTDWCCDTLHDLLACGYWMHAPMEGHCQGGVIHGGTDNDDNEIWIQFCPGCGEKIQYAKQEKPNG